MENLSIEQACRMRDDLRGSFDEQQRQRVRIWLYKLPVKPETWGVSIHLEGSGFEPSDILPLVPEQRHDNVRFYNPQLIENQPLAS
ncbi:MAG TPA: hypothetical protein VFI84_01035 [Candidatus Saccharimonadales bacterium]|nr:hypothetical protein [Candidatus Saccharimonadales bacterium]